MKCFRGFFGMVFILFVFAPSASPATFLVKPDGSGDFPTIQDAINASVDGDTLELSDGVFSGTGNRDIEYFGKAITVKSQSGNPNACIIDCGGSAAEPHRGFRLIGEPASAMLIGVTIRGGFAPLSPGLGNDGGAILISNSSVITIRNCNFVGNIAPNDGGGIAMADSDPTIENCTFSGNSADNRGGGMFCVSNSKPTITNCTFSSNSATASGGGLAMENLNAGPATVQMCTFIGNTANNGGGLYCVADTNPIVSDCVFDGNSATRDGGGLLSITNSTPLLSNCQFSNNVAERGGRGNC